METTMSYASDLTTTTSVPALSAPTFDVSLLVVVALSALGMVLSIAATMINPGWFVG
jgi:hypothetical protein